MNKYLLLTLFTTLILLTACGEQKIVTSEIVDSGAYPAWYIENFSDEQHKQFYYGRGRGSSIDPETARKKAYISAKQELAESIQSKITSRIRKAVSESGLVELDNEQISATFDSAIQLSVSLTLKNVLPYKQQAGSLKDKNGAAVWFVGLKVSKKEIAEEAEKKMKAAVRKNITSPQTRSQLNSLFDDDFFGTK